MKFDTDRADRVRVDMACLVEGFDRLTDTLLDDGRAPPYQMVAIGRNGTVFGGVWEVEGDDLRFEQTAYYTPGFTLEFPLNIMWVDARGTVSLDVLEK